MELWQSFTVAIRLAAAHDQRYDNEHELPRPVVSRHSNRRVDAKLRSEGELELRQELPHLGLRPGLVASAGAFGGAIHRSRSVTSPVERAPLGGVPWRAALIFRANVRQSLRQGRSLRGAAVVLDESLADRFPG